MSNFNTTAHRLAGSLATLALAMLMGCGSNEADKATTTAVKPPPAPTRDSWALLNFTKVDSVNPIMGPSTVGRFQDPILKQEVLWEEKDVFNPAVVVKDGMVYMLYRAENIIPSRFTGEIE